MTPSPRPKRILMLLENCAFPEDHRVFLEAEALVGTGYDVTVICPTGASRRWSETVSGIRVYRYPAPFELDGFLGYALEYSYSLTMLFLISLYVLCRHGFDVVHMHTPPDMTAVIAIFHQFLGKRFVFDHHDLSPELYLARKGRDQPDVLYRMLRFFERMACRRADRLIATNATQRAIQIDRGGARPELCYIVRNGPNSLFLSDVTPQPELCQPGRLVLGYVGAIGIQDGVDYLVRAVKQLKFDHGRTDFLAVIVGNGPALPRLKALAAELGVADVILFTGRIPIQSVPRHIAAFDVCFTPDPSNAYNDSCTTIKTMEYMALRKPTVLFRTRENELTAGESGLYAENNDISDLVAKALQLMDDPALRQELGTVARRRIEDGLTWKHQAVVLLALYRDLFGVNSQDASEPSAVLPTISTESARVGQADDHVTHPAPSHELAPHAAFRFPFNGAVGQVLKRHCEEDARRARLSAQYRIYYRLRPFIPIRVRQALQRVYGKNVKVPPRWYLPTRFISDLRGALEREAETLVIHPWPDGAQIAIVLTHDVESAAGLKVADQVASLEERLGFRSAWNIVPYNYPVDRGLLADLKARGHEIGVHGFNHDGRLFESRRTFDRRTGPINLALAEFGSTGFRAPMVHRNLAWQQALNIDFDLSCFDIDPYQAMPGGVGSPWPFFAGKFVELPYTLPQDHTLLVTFGESTPRVWIEKVEYLRPLAGLVLTLTHPDYLDSPARLAVYHEFLEFLRQQTDAWCALPQDVAQWWRARDQIQIVDDQGEPRLVGPMAHRARLFKLGDLQLPPRTQS